MTGVKKGFLITTVQGDAWGPAFREHYKECVDYTLEGHIFRDYLFSASDSFYRPSSLGGFSFRLLSYRHLSFRGWHSPKRGRTYVHGCNRPILNLTTNRYRTNISKTTRSPSIGVTIRRIQ